MGLFSKISKAFKKVVKFSTGGLIGGHSNSGQSTPEVPAPELGFVDADTTNTTESESEKQQLTKGKKRGKKSLKVDMAGSGGTGRNIV
nr:MAG: virion assembly protein [Bacteriophage sp.]